MSLVLVLASGCYRDVADAPTSGGPGADPTMDPAAPAPGGPAISGDGTPGTAGVIDFGAAPTGAATLNTVSCPALTMPSAAASKGAIYVDVNAKGSELGTKAAPFRTIAKAFGAAGPKGVIWVAAGKYPEQVLIPNKGLTVLGGFAPGFGSRSDACATVLEAPNKFAPILSAGNDVKGFAIEGVSVTKGSRGLMVLGDVKTGASFTVARCVFAENGDKNEVGGAAVFDQVNARVFGSVFRNNVAAKGAAMAGAGNVKLTIDQNAINENLGYSDHGGGLYLNAASSVISHNTFRGNATGVDIKGGWGGAVIVYSNSLNEIAHVDFSYNVFTENVAGIGGAVFFDDGTIATMSHDLFYRNRAYPENGVIRGNAIYVDGTGLGPEGASTFTGEYLTVVNNNYDDKGQLGTPGTGGNIYIEGFSKATFTNSIFWNNGDNAFYVEGGLRGTIIDKNELSVLNSIAPGACVTGTDNGFVPASAASCKIGAGVFLPTAINFGDEASDDYHEKSTSGRYVKGGWIQDAVTSPAIDKADPAAPVGNEPMPNGGRANLGAFSRTSEASKSP